MHQIALTSCNHTSFQAQNRVKIEHNTTERMKVTGTAKSITSDTLYGNDYTAGRVHIVVFVPSRFCVGAAEFSRRRNPGLGKDSSISHGRSVVWRSFWPRAFYIREGGTKIWRIVSYRKYGSAVTYRYFRLMCRLYVTRNCNSINNKYCTYCTIASLVVEWSSLKACRVWKQTEDEIVGPSDDRKDGSLPDWMDQIATPLAYKFHAQLHRIILVIYLRVCILYRTICPANFVR